MLDHGVKRNALGRLSGEIELVNILTRQKTFRDDRIKISCTDQQKSRSRNRGEFMPKHDLQAAVVCIREPVLDPFEEIKKAAVFLLVRRLQETAAEHGCERERDKTRDNNRRHDRHRKLVQQPAQDASHE